MAAEGADVLVVGGGIGGLAAALAFAKKGCSVLVLEAASEFSAVGAGIQLSPNGTRVLFELGLRDALMKKGTAFVPEAAEMRAWNSGAVLVSMPLGKRVESKFGFPYLHIHRADLHEILLRAVRDASPAIRLENNVRVATVEQQPTHAAVRSTDGKQYSAKVVIGADGIRSAVRGALFASESPPRFTGCVAWRALIPAAKLENVVQVRPRATIWVGPGAHLVHYFVRGGTLVNVVAVVEVPQGNWNEGEPWTQPGNKSELIAAFQGWNPDVCKLLSAIGDDEASRWALFDRNPLPRWSKGRATLLGDASHPMLPFIAQGACMALEDAIVVADCVAGDTSQNWAKDVSTNLERYEALRRERTAQVQLTARKHSSLYHARGAPAKIRDVAFKLARAKLISKMEALYEYNAVEAVAT
mmetsp:Transcript_12832/g.34545  ORF Transcript_12832/g.34545 Transcript_12832/m.34545 type:complete len:414 (+) Transcript_12832:108-1349(+)